jgi:hypothetical protein
MRVETIGDCTLILGDSKQSISDLAYDSVVTDPPFGMAFIPCPHSRYGQAHLGKQPRGRYVVLEARRRAEILSR